VPTKPLPAVAQPLGIKYAQNKVDAYAPLLEQVQGGSTFFAFSWCDVEPTQGTYNWSSTDKAVASAKRFNEQLMFKVSTGSCWATKPSSGAKGNGRNYSEVPKDPGQYRSFVSDLLNRYWSMGVHEWAVENEVNGPNHYAGTTSDYDALVRAFAEAAKADHPDAVVLDQGNSSTAWGVGIVQALLDQNQDDAALAAYRSYYAARFGARDKDFPPVSTASELRQASKGSLWQRDLAFLSESVKLRQAGVIDALQVHFYEPWANVPALMNYIHTAFPKGTPVEVWEAGIYSQSGPTDLAAQANDVVKLTTLLLADGCRRVNYLPAAADPGGKGAAENNWGLLEPDGAARPAGDAFARLAALVSSGTYAPVQKDGLQGLTITRADGSSAVVWSGGTAPTVVAAAPPAGVSATDVTGSPVVWPSTGLSVGSQPVVIDGGNVATAVGLT
jgi:hypothetical protein